jgi:hypothetical protein
MPRSSSYGMLTCAVRGGMGPNSIVTERIPAAGTESVIYALHRASLTTTAVPALLVLLRLHPCHPNRLLMPRSSSYGMLTCAVRGGMGPNSIVTVRCLPVEDDGLLQLSGTDAGDAIMGDVDTEPRPGMMGQQQGQGGAHRQQVRIVSICSC